MAHAAPRPARYQETDRGRGAARPTDIPSRGWKDVLTRLKDAVKRDDVPLLSAGVAFFALLSLVPAMVALVSIYGLVADPADIQRNVDDLLAAAPDEVQDLVSSQLDSIVTASSTGLTVGLLGGLAVALWSASTGVKHLITAVNRAYDEDETRGFVRLRGLSLALTVGGLVLVGVTVLGFVVFPNSLSSDGGEGVVRTALLIVRWPILAAIAMAALAVVYRYAPDRSSPRWSWASAGAVVATIVWIIASIAFSIYTANFGQYNETYGALGAVVIVMLWLLITAFVVIAGAELNAEMEHQTAEDTTARPEREMGDREAYVADTLGDSTDGG
jgi:membrane protein